VRLITESKPFRKIVCFSAYICGMDQAFVDEEGWVKLNNQLVIIHEDAGKVNSFMDQHVNKKWEV
jgi:hypothetical protein